MAPTLRIGTENAEFQLVQSLFSNRRQRQRQGRFPVEGVRAIDAAVANGWPIEAFWYAAGATLSRWARSHLERGAARRHVELAPELMARLSEREEASELIAIARIAADDLARIQPGGGPLLVLAFDRPTGPGNLGSVIRSADAFGADGLVVTGHAADVYDPLAVRASMGALFALPVVRAGMNDVVETWPEAQVVGTSARAERPVAEVDFTRPTILALGNETKGLSWAWRERCDELATIPIAGAAGSLNVAAAAAIVLYEVDRQRRGA